jgi:hypothetical protein
MMASEADLLGIVSDRSIQGNKIPNHYRQSDDFGLSNRRRWFALGSRIEETFLGNVSTGGGGYESIASVGRD